MKKIMIFALMCIMNASVFALESNTCLLQHNGAVTIYNGSALTSAIDAAVKGDTVYLSEGTFTGFTLTKEITVRGMGTGTLLSSGVTISIPNTPTLTQTLLEGLSLSSKNITLSTAMNGVKIKQCNFYNLEVSADNDKIELDRCIVKNYLYQYSCIKGFTANNCKIRFVYASSNTGYYNTSNVFNYYRCNIYTLYNDYGYLLKGNFTDCIIKTYGGYNTFYVCNFINCLKGFSWTMGSTATAQSCYYDSSMTMDDATMEIGYPTDQLQIKGYLGDDGDVVGCYGGKNPYTLSLSVPVVTSSTLTLDTANQKIKAKISVGIQ